MSFTLAGKMFGLFIAFLRQIIALLIVEIQEVILIKFAIGIARQIACQACQMGHVQGQLW